jgi:hypothetical protein
MMNLDILFLSALVFILAIACSLMGDDMAKIKTENANLVNRIENLEKLEKLEKIQNLERK